MIRQTTILTGLILCFGAAAKAADDDAATQSAQQAQQARQVAEIRARIAQLEAKEARRIADDARAATAAESAAVSRELTDETHQADQLLTAEGFTAGYTDNRFVIQSSDGKFLIRPWIQIQFRGVVLERNGFQGNNNHPENEVDSGFEVRQLRFGFEGNMFSKDVTYFCNWATQKNSSNVAITSTTAKGTVSNSLGGVPLLQQAWVKYHFPDTPFYVRGGELKDPLLHEQIVDTRFQQLAERSLSADIFANGDDFTEAVTAIYDPNAELRVEAGVNHGMRSANTNFLDYPNNGGFNQFNYGVVGRAEYKVMGKWNDYSRLGAVGISAPLLVFGAGADYSERGHAGQTVAVFDATYADPGGLSLYGEFIDRYTTHNFGYYGFSPTGANILAGDPAVLNRPTNEYAVVGQAGFVINQHLEPFARYEFIHLQGTPAGSHNWIQAISAGANYYFYAHRLKLTGQGTYLPDGLPFDDQPNDVLSSLRGRGEFAFIAQLQLQL